MCDSSPRPPIPFVVSADLGAAATRMSTVHVAETWRERVRAEEAAAMSQERYNKSSAFGHGFGGRSPFNKAPALRPVACLPLHINLIDSSMIANGMRGCMQVRPASRNAVGVRPASSVSPRRPTPFQLLHTQARADFRGSTRMSSSRSTFPPAPLSARGFGGVTDSRIPWR